MKGTKLEKMIIGHILMDPAMIKELDITKYFFSIKKLQSVFEEITNGNTDIALISENLKFKDSFEYLSSLMDGIPHTDSNNVPKYINEVLIDRFKLKVIKLLDEGSATGLYDDDKIKDLYKKIESLEVPKEKYVSRSLDEFEPVPIQWFWYNKIPRGSLSFLVGDPGAGKSLLSLYMAASVTKASDWPDVKLAPGSKPGSVIILTAEDNISDTVRVRCDAMGANVKKIYIFEGILSSGSDFFDIGRHLVLLEREIKRLGDVRLIVFDPITAYMGGTEGNKNIQVRTALAPLKDIAEINDLSIIGVNHMNKNQAQSALYRTMGSIAFTAAARATWLVQIDEEDKDKKRRFFVPLQTNTCKNPTSLAFNVEGPLGRPVVSFESTSVDITAAELLADEEKKDRYTAKLACKEFLINALKDGPIESKLLNEWAADNGISGSTIDRVKNIINVRCYQKNGKWWTELKT